jgi:hypothetical protein
LLPDARAFTTHAITITAPAHEVWPWLVQMGWGRAGWYTYRWVDRLLFPANGPSADQLLPEHQQLEVGDHIPDGPPASDCWFTVERLEPDRLLVLRSTRHLPASWRQRGLGMEWIWSWHLSEPAPGRTRLIQRNRMRLDPAWFERAFLATIIPADFVMARSHLRGLRRRAQASSSQPITAEPGEVPADVPISGRYVRTQRGSNSGGSAKDVGSLLLAGCAALRHRSAPGRGVGCRHRAGAGQPQGSGPGSGRPAPLGS